LCLHALYHGCESWGSNLRLHFYVLFSYNYWQTLTLTTKIYIFEQNIVQTYHLEEHWWGKTLVNCKLAISSWVWQSKLSLPLISFSVVTGNLQVKLKIITWKIVKCDRICKKVSYSLSNQIHVTVQCVTYENDTSLSFGYFTLLAWFYTWEAILHQQVERTMSCN